MDTKAKREYGRVMANNGQCAVRGYASKGGNQHAAWYLFDDGSRVVAWDEPDGSPRALQHDLGPSTSGAVGMCKYGSASYAASKV